MDEYKDQELLYLIEDNDDDAYEILYKKYMYLVKLKMNQYKGTIKRLQLDWQEVYQECLFSFVKALDNYKYVDKLSLKNYILKIIDQRFIDILRRKNVKNKIPLIRLDEVIDDNGTTLLDVIPDIKTNIEDNLIILEQLENKDILSDFELLILNYIIIGYSLNEIANLTNKTIKQINNALYRMRTKLKKAT